MGLNVQEVLQMVWPSARCPAEEMSYHGLNPVSYGNDNSNIKGGIILGGRALHISSADVRWIESHIGRKLAERLMTKAMIPLLSREKW